MYLKGYSILVTGDNGRIQTLPKWDFGGDKPYTNRAWNGIVASLEEIDSTNYPLIVSDLDNEEEASIVIETKEEFDSWMKSAFSK